MSEQQKSTAQQLREWQVARYGQHEKQMSNAVSRIQKTLPKGMNAQQLVQITLNSFTKNPKLLECTPTSVLGCVLTSAQLGLKPDGVTGEAYLIPFFNNGRGVSEAQFIPGYRGLSQLAYRSGLVKRFQPRAVMEGDDFDYAMGTTEYIRHKQHHKSEKPIFFYAVLEMVNSGVAFDVMSDKQVLNVRNKHSKNWASDVKYKREAKSLWTVHYDIMGMKTVIRKLSKTAPLTSEFQLAVSLDEMNEIRGVSQNMEAVTIDDSTTPLEKLTVVNEALKAESLEFEMIDDDDENSLQTKFMKKGEGAIADTLKKMKEK